MEISSSSNTIEIEGNIKSISDFQEIKSSVDDMIHNHKNITINVKNSISITSSVLGYFNKIILKDKIVLNLNVGNAQLIILLDDLNLSKVFNVKKV